MNENNLVRNLKAISLKSGKEIKEKSTFTLNRGESDHLLSFVDKSMQLQQDSSVDNSAFLARGKGFFKSPF